MRKLTLGRFPETSLGEARKEAATVLARVWSGEAVAPARKIKAPLFRDFAARYRERRKGRWKPSSLKTFDIYMKNRLMPAFGKMRLDTIDHARVSAWIDAASASRPGAANRSFEILRAMLGTARQWGELGEHVPDACANIVMNPRKPVARFLNREELERLGAVLDRHAAEQPWPVAALRLLTLTGARLFKLLNLRWDEIGELSDGGGRAVDWLDGGSARPVPSGSRKPAPSGILDRLAGKPTALSSGGPEKDDAEPGSPPGWIRI